MSRVCFGCGSVLQCDNELLPGFIPKSKIESANYCKRCFRLTHYGDINGSEEEKSTKVILDNVNKDNIFKKSTIYILNFISFSSSNKSINFLLGFFIVKGAIVLLRSNIKHLTLFFFKLL